MLSGDTPQISEWLPTQTGGDTYLANWIQVSCTNAICIDIWSSSVIILQIYQWYNSWYHSSSALCSIPKALHNSVPKIYIHIYIYTNVRLWHCPSLPDLLLPPALPHHWTPWHPQGKEAQFLPARERFEATCRVSQLLDRTYRDVFGDLYLNVTYCDMSSNVVWPWLSFMLLIDVDCGGVYRYMKEYMMWIMHVYSCKYLYKKKSTVHSSIMCIDA